MFTEVLVSELGVFWHGLSEAAGGSGERGGGREVVLGTGLRQC